MSPFAIRLNATTDYGNSFPKYVNMTCSDTDHGSEWSLPESDADLVHDYIINRNDSKLAKQMRNQIKDSRYSQYLKYLTFEEEPELVVSL